MLSLRKMPIEERRAYFRAAARKSYILNRDAVLERQRARYAASLDEKREYHRNYQRMRQEKGLVKRNPWTEADNISRAQWRKENPAALIASNHRRRQRKLEAAGNGVTRTEWLQIMADFGYLCAYCAAPSSPLTMEHVDPLSHGGEHDTANVVPACLSCNTSKGSKQLLLWLHRTAQLKAG